MFDLVNIDIGGHNGYGMPFNASANVYNPTVRKVDLRHGVRSDDTKAAKALVKHIKNADTFSPATFAYFVSQAGPRVNIMLFKVFEHLLTIWAKRAETDMCNSDAEYNIGIESRRIIDAYRSTYGKGTEIPE